VLASPDAELGALILDQHGDSLRVVYAGIDPVTGLPARFG
jgi:hypothetical protein